MDWFLPITILPASGLLIMSTTNQMMGLSAEIGSILAEKCTPCQHQVAEMKIKQLGLLTKSITLLYASAAFFVMSGLVSATVEDKMLSKSSEYVLILGVIMVLLALIMLIIYGFGTIRIRKFQHQQNQQT